MYRSWFLKTEVLASALNTARLSTFIIAKLRYNTRFNGNSASPERIQSGLADTVDGTGEMWKDFGGSWWFSAGRTRVCFHSFCLGSGRRLFETPMYVSSARSGKHRLSLPAPTRLGGLKQRLQCSCLLLWPNRFAIDWHHLSGHQSSCVCSMMVNLPTCSEQIKCFLVTIRF